MTQIPMHSPQYKEIMDKDRDSDEPVPDECPSCEQESVLWITEHEGKTYVYCGSCDSLFLEDEVAS